MDIFRVTCVAAIAAFQPALALEVPAETAMSRCEALMGMAFPPTALSLPTNGARITSATFVASGAPQNPNGDYCRVLGSVRPVDPSAPDILLQINLPRNWNERALQMGGGGYNGRIPNTLQAPSNGQRNGPTPLATGYITFASDSGHQAASGDDASFGLNDEALANYGGQHIKKARDVAVAAASAYYGQAPRRIYFAGGSTGGREALTAALRWPEAYDGVISNYPTANFIGLRLWGAALAKAIYADNSAGWIPPAMVERIARESMAACDGLDGLADGVVSNMAACRAGSAARIARLACRRPGQADCLTRSQIDRTIRIYHEGYSTAWTSADGIRGYGGYNSLEGVAMNVGEQAAYVNPPQSGPHAHHADRAAQFAKYILARDPKFDVLDLDVQAPGEWLPRLQALAGLVGATPPDYSAFEKRGGKVLLLQGQDDVSVSPIENTRVYQRIVETMGQSRVDGFLRFYLVPGLGHGTGNFQPSWDNLKTLDDWVERGVAPPDMPVARDANPKGEGRERPLCRYPTWARYDGAGPANLATSFRCVTEQHDR
jgi:pimeloyl-ACP methyl ester carboxylesterase